MGVELPVMKKEADINLGFLISDVHRLITVAVDKELRELDLTRSQLRVFLHLLRRDGISQVQIADDLQLGKVTVGGLLDRLEEKGLVERRHHPSDRRSKLVFLAARNRSDYEPILRTGRKILERLLVGMTVDEQNLLISLLLKVKENSLNIVNGE